VARALKAYLAKQHSRRGVYDNDNDDDDDHAVRESGNPKLGFSEEPSEKYAALKKRTLLLSDDELFQVYIFLFIFRALPCIHFRENFEVH